MDHHHYLYSRIKRAQLAIFDIIIYSGKVTRDTMGRTSSFAPLLLDFQVRAFFCLLVVVAFLVCPFDV